MRRMAQAAKMTIAFSLATLVMALAFLAAVWLYSAIMMSETSQLITVIVFTAAAASLLVSFTRYSLKKNQHPPLHYELTDDLTLVETKTFVHFRYLTAPKVVVEETTVFLHDVKHVTWDASMFDPSGSLRYVLWDADPELVMGVFGFTPQNEGAKTLLRLKPEVLKMHTTVNNRLLNVLLYKQQQGELEANVDLKTGEIIPNEVPPLKDGIRFEGKTVIWEPNEEEDRQ